MKRTAILLATALLALAAPAVATAQFGPTNVPAPLTQPDPNEAAPTDDGGGGLSTLQLVLIFGAAIGVVALIAYVIMRDARGAAPADERGRSDAKGSDGEPSKPARSAREREREQARKRAKAKAARNQRKRNRSR